MHFIVRGEKRDLVPIYIRHGKIDGRIKTGFMVEPSRWSNETETIRQRKLSTSDEVLIKRLDELRAFIRNEEKLHPGERSTTWLQGLINKFHGIKEDTGSDTLNSFLDDFIEKAASGERKNKNGLNLAKGTITSLKGFQRALLEYQGIYSPERVKEFQKKDPSKKLRRKKIVDFEDVTIDFYNDFVAYLSNEDFKPNTMDKFIGLLKYIMRKALQEKKHSNREFLETAFAGFSEESHAVYLNNDEIDKIYTADLSEFSAGHSMARDAFIVLCETALRISDYKKVDLSIKGQLIYLYQTKTAGRVVLPISPRLQEILGKYEGRLPTISDQKINKYIKDVCKKCEINEKVTWIAHNKGMKHETSAEKWELITCHTGRRSAATNMYLAGISSIDIMKITGHKTEKSFMKYIRITEEETANKLLKHPFFNRNLKVV